MNPVLGHELLISPTSQLKSSAQSQDMAPQSSGIGMDQLVMAEHIAFPRPYGGHLHHDKISYLEMAVMGAPMISHRSMYDMHRSYGELQSPTTMTEFSLSPSPPPPPRIYKPCVVCNDKSSGYHYGVSSCEGCKGFFRRSVQKNMQYTCHKDKICQINKVTRNRCQYCRLQKCCVMGMSKEAVRNDRNKKKKKHHDSECGGSRDIDELTEHDQALIQDILQAYRYISVTDDEDDSYCLDGKAISLRPFLKREEPVLEVKVKEEVQENGFMDEQIIISPPEYILQSAAALHSSSSSSLSSIQPSLHIPQSSSSLLSVISSTTLSSSVRSSSSSSTLSFNPLAGEDIKHDITNGHATPSKEKRKDGSEEQNVILWERVTELSSRGIIRIVEFAKKIHGFTDLSTSDQITLLKAACLEIIILRLCSKYDLEKDTMNLPHGPELGRQQVTTGAFGPLTDTIFNYAASLKRMDVGEVEFAILTAICLMSGDRSGLEESERVEQIQEPILEALKHYIRTQQPSRPFVFAKLLMKLTDLRTISIKGAEGLLQTRLEMPGDLPPLIVEMLHRVENVCIP